MVMVMGMLLLLAAHTPLKVQCHELTPSRPNSGSSSSGSGSSNSNNRGTQQTLGWVLQLMQPKEA